MVDFPLPSLHHLLLLLSLLPYLCLSSANFSSHIVFDPTSLTLVPQQSANVSVYIDGQITEAVVVNLREYQFIKIGPSSFSVASPNETTIVEVTADQPVNEVIVEVASCDSLNGSAIDCPFDITSSFVSVKIVRSNALSIVVTVVGWAYFLAWSVSFWPQIVLNFQRKSVIGLNFDFVLLNTIGFASYTVYNCLIYFDKDVQASYKAAYPRSPIPVLLNDVVFAVHAFLACAITGLQAIFMEKEQQRVSRTCIGWSSILVLCALVTAVLAATGVMGLLAFVNSLSYIKMAVTLSKYFPQAIMNFRRKSTVGWSIGNILLDFTGGTLDLLQVALQGYNVANFSAIIGNPVKFGLGFVSIFFDIIFMIQHYVLYRDVQVVGQYEEIEEVAGSEDRQASVPTERPDDAAGSSQ